MKLILASNSPRRRQLLTELGLTYETRLLEVDEDFPDHLRRAEVAEYLAAHKAAAYKGWLAKEVQEAIDDPRPSVPHSEVLADWATDRAGLVKRAESMEH